jgi:hypothetical protein
MAWMNGMIMMVRDKDAVVDGWHDMAYGMGNDGVPFKPMC